MKEVCAHDIKMLHSKINRLEQDLDDMMGRFELVSKLWDAVNELQDMRQRQGDFLAHTLLLRERK
tara:strand:+ start:819 stop:1013 length:195 start_codon:yes stop_codon:yes gene_type:complete